MDSGGRKSKANTAADMMSTEGSFPDPWSPAILFVPSRVESKHVSFALFYGNSSLDPGDLHSTKVPLLILPQQRRGIYIGI